MKTYFYFVTLFFSFLSGGMLLFAQDLIYPKTFSLSDVKLLDGPFKQACDLNIEVLLEYDTDRLLAPYLKEAGLTPKGLSFDNWIGLDGHVGGHYLSALAIHYAATGDEACKNRMDYMIAELKRCQDKNGDGYVGGIPGGMTIWNNVKNGNPTAVASGWVPWYNLHKTYAGLRDAWVYAQREEAKQMFLALCDWGLTIITPLSDSQMESMLNTEFGGMNEVYADAYYMTGDVKYLNAAKRFAHKIIFDSMSKRVDNLDNTHANTQVPKAIGYQRVAELTGDNLNTTAARFFWETVTQKRSLSIGGNSRREHFPPAADCISYTEERDGPESCNTNNMLKLTAGLFRMDPSVEYVDFYERALFNHIRSTQHPEHGGYVYFTSARPRHYRVYSAPNKAMWCCVGTGMENHGKYGEFIYAYSGDSLFVNLFIASELNWKAKDVKISQQTGFPEEETSKLTITVAAPTQLKLLIRYPSWVAAGTAEVICDGINYASKASPSSYVVIDRVWNNGDEVSVKFPMQTTIESMPNVSNYVSILHGPIVLGAKTGTENLVGLVANEDRWAHLSSGPLMPLFDAPILIGQQNQIFEKLKNLQPIEGKPLSFTCPDLFIRESNKKLVLEPFYGIHDTRYMMYWQTMTETQYETVREQLEKEEREKLILDARTVDAVAPGEQQPEVDHNMQIQNSYTGFHQEEGWRDARDGGYVSYNLMTKGEATLSLMVRYWGNENGNRTFDILIDGVKLVTENVSGKWRKNEFVNVEYSIPASMFAGKESITVRFQSSGNNIVGGLFYVRLLKPEQIMSNNIYKTDTVSVICGKGEIQVQNAPVNDWIRVYDVVGQLIAQKQLLGMDMRLELSSGLYVVAVGDGTQNSVKVIVE